MAVVVQVPKRWSQAPNAQGGFQGHSEHGMGFAAVRYVVNVTCYSVFKSVYLT